MVCLTFPLSLVLLCTMSLTTHSDITSHRLRANHHLEKVLPQRLEGHHSTGVSGNLRLLHPATSHLLEQHTQKLRSLPPLRKQRRSCNTATCVTHRLADLLSRSGALSSNFTPTDVGARAFGRKRRGVRA